MLGTKTNTIVIPMKTGNIAFGVISSDKIAQMIPPMNQTIPASLCVWFQLFSLSRVHGKRIPKK